MLVQRERPNEGTTPSESGVKRKKLPQYHY
jgi:hypothetical protein